MTNHKEHTDEELKRIGALECTLQPGDAPVSIMECQYGITFEQSVSQVRQDMTIRAVIPQVPRYETLISDLGEQHRSGGVFSVTLFNQAVSVQCQCVEMLFFTGIDESVQVTVTLRTVGNIRTNGVTNDAGRGAQRNHFDNRNTVW